MTRSEVYQLIDGERDFQNSFVTPGFAAQVMSSDPSFLSVDEPYSAEEEALMILSYASKLPDLYTQNAGINPMLAQIRKIAALCVRCMEDHGAPAR